jgi:hypothetical protein
MTLPAGNGRLFFAGEAISTRHAWVEGALDSACRAIHAYFSISKATSLNSFAQFLEELGIDRHWRAQPPLTPGEIITPPVLGPLPQQESKEGEEDHLEPMVIPDIGLYAIRGPLQYSRSIVGVTIQDKSRDIVQRDPYLQYLAANGF